MNFGAPIPSAPRLVEVTSPVLTGLLREKIMSTTLPLAFLSMPGGLEWIVIGLVALLLFGKRLPSVARSLGEAFHEFKNGFSGEGVRERKDGGPEGDGDADKG